MEQSRHDPVHHNLAKQGGIKPLEKAADTFTAECLEDTLHWAFEASLGGLEANFHCMERMSDCILSYSGENS